MYTFKKEERLCSKKLIDELFHNGSSFLIYPFKVVHLQASASPSFPVQVVIIVPKRRFRRANVRNLLKRRIREAYRLNKSAVLYPFLEANNLHLTLSLQYVGKEVADFDFIEKKLRTVFTRINEIYAEASHPDV